MSKLEDYLNIDISSLLAKGDYQTLRDVERYLNKSARQRLSRLEKAGLLEDHRSKTIKSLSSLDFSTTYINKYKPSNAYLKKYQNQILHSISNARQFLNMKSSSVSMYKKWTMSNKKVGIKFKSEKESIKFYNLWNTLNEVAGSTLENLGSKERYKVVMVVAGLTTKSKLSWRENKAYRNLEKKLSSAQEFTKEKRLREEYFNKDK